MSLGSDFSGIDDVDYALTFLEGELPERLAFVQAIQRRLSTPRGALWYDESYGLDVRTFLSDNISPAVAQGAIAAEIRKDERVANAEVSVTVDDLGKWTINMTVSALTQATFELTFKLDSTKLTLLVPNA
jgi:phage baseplate assembly protein W